MPNPKEIALELRKIAQAIENSKNPSRKLVSDDLKKVAALLGNVIEKEQVDMFSALNALISRLERVFKTLDENTMDRSLIEKSIQQLDDFRLNFKNLFIDELSDINV